MGHISPCPNGYRATKEAKFEIWHINTQSFFPILAWSLTGPWRKLQLCFLPKSMINVLQKCWWKYTCWGIWYWHNCANNGSRWIELQNICEILNIFQICILHRCCSPLAPIIRTFYHSFTFILWLFICVLPYQSIFHL